MRQFPNLPTHRQIDPAILERPVRFEPEPVHHVTIGEALFFFIVVPALVWLSLVVLP